eukprot:1159878-Pelagomonas_calceolata.AAC.4
MLLRKHNFILTTIPRLHDKQVASLFEAPRDCPELCPHFRPRERRSSMHSISQDNGTYANNRHRDRAHLHLLKFVLQHFMVHIGGHSAPEGARHLRNARRWLLQLTYVTIIYSDDMLGNF